MTRTLTELTGRLLVMAALLLAIVIAPVRADETVISSETEAVETLSPFTILPPPEQSTERVPMPDGTDSVSGLAPLDQLPPAYVPPESESNETPNNQSAVVALPDVSADSFAPGDATADSSRAVETVDNAAFDLPPAYIPPASEPESPSKTTELSFEIEAPEGSAESGVNLDTGDMAPIEPPNVEQAALDSVFPSLPSPEEKERLRVAQMGDPGIVFSGTPSSEQPVVEPQIVPAGPHDGWWQPHVGSPMRNTAMPRTVTINSLLASALQHSSQVRVLSDSPLIRDTAIVEADAAFDWSTFMETSWNDINEPVGSTLTTGGPPRFRNSRFDFEAGLRRTTGIGGQFEAAQRYGHEESNSIFFVPNNQGTSRLTLSYTQPLLRGAGRAYNTSLIVLAQIDSAIARDDFSRELQDHLLEITRAYWTLYLERASLLQRQRLYDRGQQILQELEYRESIDAVQNQIVRARASVASRKSDLYRAAAAVKNAEGRIRALVNDPSLGLLDEFELMPEDMPSSQVVSVDIRDSLEMAIRNRPEINVAMKQIKASAIRMKMSKNELLPLLDVVLETYVAGLRGNSGIGRAWEQQFSDGAPSYTAGLQFEVPLRNRASRARFQRRSLELRQFENQFKNAIQALQLEIEIAVREVQTSYREIQANAQSMKAAETEVDYIANRWELLPGEDRSASLILEDLLAAQERLAAEEFELANAHVTYNLALTNLKRAMGTLLQCESVSATKSDDCGIPSIHLQKESLVPASHDVPALEFGPE